MIACQPRRGWSWGRQRKKRASSAVDRAVTHDKQRPVLHLVYSQLCTAQRAAAPLVMDLSQEAEEVGFNISYCVLSRSSSLPLVTLPLVTPLPYLEIYRAKRVWAEAVGLKTWGHMPDLCTATEALTSLVLPWSVLFANSVLTVISSGFPAPFCIF